MHAKVMVEMNKRIIITLLIGVCLGAFVGYMIPYLLPKKTIYNKLAEARVYPHNGDWYIEKLLRARNFEQIRHLGEFILTYREQINSTLYPEWVVVYVNIDPFWNVVWMEAYSDWQRKNLEYLGFYFYSEPDYIDRLPQKNIW